MGSLGLEHSLVIGHCVIGHFSIEPCFAPREPLDNSAMFKIIGADREEYGPVSAEELRAWIVQGRADGRTMAQMAGSADWKPLADFPEFAAALASAVAAKPAPPPLVSSAALAAPLRSEVPTYLVWSILLTLLCCLLGFPAIIYAAQVTSKLDRGDAEGARRASANARIWCWVAFVLGAIQYLITVLALGWFLKNNPMLP